MENEVRLNIKLTAELLERIKVAAKAKHLTVSSLTRLLLINYVENLESGQENTGPKTKITY